MEMSRYGSVGTAGSNHKRGVVAVHIPAVHSHTLPLSFTCQISPSAQVARIKLSRTVSVACCHRHRMCLLNLNVH